MAERVEDLNLPNAVVGRLIKDSLPEGVSVAKEARQALAKGASIFVLFLTSASNNVATKHNRKTIGAQDVLQAIKDSDFDSFVAPLQDALENFKKAKKEKKDAKESSVKRKSLPKEETKEDNKVVAVIDVGDSDSTSASAIVVSDDE